MIRNEVIPFPVRRTTGERGFQSTLRDKINTALGGSDKARIAAIARQHQMLLIWVDDTVSSVDRKYAIEQLEAALTAVKRSP